MKRKTVGIASDMARHLVELEYQGWGDTQGAATARASIKAGVTESLLKRLVYGEVRDMLVSNFDKLSTAYHAEISRQERLFEQERKLHETSSIAVRAADLVAGHEEEER